MEILFKNSYIRNKELAQEIYRFYYFQRKWILVCYILLAISLLGNALGAIMGDTYSVGVFVCVPLFLALQFYCYFRQVHTMVKRDQEVHGKEIEVETIVTDSYIQNTASTGAIHQLEYDKIKNAIQTKNLILLRSKANLIYIFRKNSFDVGTKEDFILFLKSKGIAVKGK